MTRPWFSRHCRYRLNLIYDSSFPATCERTGRIVSSLGASCRYISFHFRLKKTINVKYQMITWQLLSRLQFNSSRKWNLFQWRERFCPRCTHFKGTDFSNFDFTVTSNAQKKHKGERTRLLSVPDQTLIHFSILNIFGTTTTNFQTCEFLFGAPYNLLLTFAVSVWSMQGQFLWKPNIWPSVLQKNGTW